MNLEELIEKYTNDQSRFVEVDGHSVHYRDEGEGEVLLLVHGTFASLHCFDEWVELMKSKFRVVRLDLPGFGLTGPTPDNKYGIDRFCEFLNQFLKVLEISKCSIAGNSLGGWLCWEFAVRFPFRVNKMILIDSAGYISDGSYPLPFVIAQTPVLRNVFNYVPKAVVRRFLRQVFYDQTKVTEQVVQRYFDLFHREGNKEAFVKIANVSYVQNTDKLNLLQMPVLVMWGEKDSWIGMDHADKFCNDLKFAEKIIYPGVGHVPMEEIPAQTANDALTFLLN